MKFVLSFFAAALLFAGQPAQATVDNCLKVAGCSSTITVNSGHTGNWCKDTGGCECDYAGTGCLTTWTTSGTCTGGARVGTTATGLKCCGSSCSRAPQSPEVNVDSTSDDSLQAVFSEDSRTDIYFGVVDNTNRSPSAGRSNKAAAFVDACMGHATVTGYTVGNQISWNACNSDCDAPLKNGYCNDTGTNNGSSQTNFRCKDRCDCYVGTFNGGTCENL